jgi:hypothetical protein
MTRRTTKSLPSSDGDKVYKGYMLKVSPFTPNISIQKDGYHIAWGRNLEHAKRVVDELTTGYQTNPKTPE